MDAIKKIEELKARVLGLIKDKEAGKEISKEMDEIQAEVEKLRDYMRARGLDPDTGMMKE